MQQIVLASGSPRRKEILELLGLQFEVAESGFDESLIVSEEPKEMVEELALQKALAVAKRYPDAVIIGGDTTVDLDGESIGKAKSEKEAKQMFGRLLGRAHRVWTGVAVVNSLTGESRVGSEWGEVSFRKATAQELAKYAANESNWQGFAGAYALQGGARSFVTGQTGVFSAIIGLPVQLIVSLLEEMGVIVEMKTEEVEKHLKSNY